MQLQSSYNELPTGSVSKRLHYTSFNLTRRAPTTPSQKKNLGIVSSLMNKLEMLRDSQPASQNSISQGSPFPGLKMAIEGALICS